MFNPSDNDVAVTDFDKTFGSFTPTNMKLSSVTVTTTMSEEEDANGGQGQGQEDGPENRQGDIVSVQNYTVAEPEGADKGSLKQAIEFKV